MSISYSNIEVMVMTDRDLRILKLLTTVRYATTKQIRDIIFPSLNPSVAYRRLEYLTNNRLILRRYYNIDKNTNSHVYYLDKPPTKKSVKHELLVTEFVVKLTKLDIELLEVEKTPIYRGIKPDLVVKMRTKAGNERIIFLEVQLSKHDTITKYFNLYTGEIPAILYIVTNNKVDPPQIRGMRCVIDNTSFKKLSFYFS